jgi:hypothetical protein
MSGIGAKMRSAADPAIARIQRCQHSCEWMLAWLECLQERRPVSVIHTEMQLKGYLI